jgi:hypothetical protein
VRWLVYTSLAYGAQGISYYVYCHPGHQGAMATADGKPTPLYHAASAFNREFAAIAAALQPLRSLAVYHAGMKPPGGVLLPEGSPFRLDPAVATKLYNPPQPIEGVLLGTFGPSDKSTHVVVVNLDYKRALSTTVVGPEPLQAFDAATGRWSSESAAKLQLPPGGGKLLRLKSAGK